MPTSSTTTTPSTTTKSTHAIIDSHIHLYAKSHLPNLNWTSTLPKNHILNRQNSVTEYKLATKSHTDNLLGFIFLETDQSSQLDPNLGVGWTNVLFEVGFLGRIARGEPLPIQGDDEGEGFTVDDASLVLGIIPWAPIPLGAKGLEVYLSKVKETCIDERTFGLVKGFRYLLQDKPRGTMIEPGFIEGLRWLGRRGYVFDLGIDCRSTGLWQLGEVERALMGVYRGEDDDGSGDDKKGEGNGLKIILNHMCKPNLHLQTSELSSSEEYTKWVEYMHRIASYKNTYMKLSGLFSELPTDKDWDSSYNTEDTTTTTTKDHTRIIKSLSNHLKPWIEVIFSAFGAERIMFGSDWPVCQAGGPGSGFGVLAWEHWVDVVMDVLTELGLSEEEMGFVWSGTARRVYGVDG